MNWNDSHMLTCFLERCDQLGTELLETLYAYGSETDWRESVALGTSAYLRWWQERPAFAHAYLVELPAAGPRAVDQRDTRLQDFAAMWESLAARARVHDRELEPLNPLAADLLGRGITEMIATEVRRGRIDRLHELDEDLAGLVCGVLGGGWVTDAAPRRD
ncbi:MAG: hypothetical protein QOE28_847 [Solirubrobacteraceae bacterium]|nr:hypothetical protein [Solirubrobacteraceae bacterium]